MFQSIADRFAQWEKGGLPYEHQQIGLVCAMKKFVAVLDEQLAELRNLRPASDELKAEIDERIADILGQHYAVVEMHNAIAEAAREGNVVKNDAHDASWKIPSFGHGWIRPHRNEDGTQTIVLACCNPGCGSEHYHDFRVQDGFVELRSFAKEKDNARTGNAEASNGARESGARSAGRSRARNAQGRFVA